VDLKDVASRIFKRHWALILVFTLLGLSVPLLYDKIVGVNYVATARIDLGPDAHGGQDSASMGDMGLGLATGPQVLSAAIKAAKVQRDPATEVGRVTVAPVGTSGVLDVSVTDTDARVAAAIANSLAAQVVKLRDDAEFGSSIQLLTQLQQRDAALSQQIAGVVAQSQQHAIVIPGLQAQETDLVAQRASVYAQEQQLAQTLATAARPRVIDASAKEGTAVPSNLTVLLPLGALLGLVVGIALAATREAMAPTLNREALARLLGAPLLGRAPHRDGSHLDPWLSGYVRSVADSAGVDTVQLVSVGRNPVDITGLAAALDAAVEEVRVVPLQLPDPVRMPDGRHGATVPEGTNASDGAIIVVVKSKFLAGLERHLQVTGQRVIGVIGRRGRIGTIVPEARDTDLDARFRNNVARDSATSIAPAS
jgi:capsular polysaccharide biosynthesis protein